MGASAELFVLMTYLCVVSERLMREPELSCLPESVQHSVERDNAKFEHWISEMKTMRVSLQ